MTNIKKASCKILQAHKGQIAPGEDGTSFHKGWCGAYGCFFCKKATGKQGNSVGPQPTTSQCNSDGTRDHKASPLTSIHFQNSLGRQHIQYSAACQQARLTSQVPRLHLCCLICTTSPSVHRGWSDNIYWHTNTPRHHGDSLPWGTGT